MVRGYDWHVVVHGEPMNQARPAEPDPNQIESDAERVARLAREAASASMADAVAAAGRLGHFHRRESKPRFEGLVAAAHIATGVGTAILATATIVVAVLAVLGLSDPIAAAIARSTLAVTVQRLTQEQQSLEMDKTDLLASMTNLEQSIRQGSDEKRSLEAKVAEDKTALDQTTAAFHQQQQQLAELNGQVGRAEANLGSARNDLATANTQLADVRGEVINQLRSILAWQAGILASQIYDARLYDHIYAKLPPGIAAMRSTPVMNDPGQCFEEFIKADVFTWSSLMGCAGKAPNFPWPPDPDERKRVQGEIDATTASCPRLTKRFTIIPDPGSGADAAVNEISEFESFEKFLTDPSNRPLFCGG